jgi:hypothetical protein
MSRKSSCNILSQSTHICDVLVFGGDGHDMNGVIDTLMVLKLKSFPHVDQKLTHQVSGTRSCQARSRILRPDSRMFIPTCSLEVDAGDE